LNLRNLLYLIQAGSPIISCEQQPPAAKAGWGGRILLGILAGDSDLGEHFRLVARTGPGAAAASPVPNGTAGAGRLPVLKGLPSFNGLAKAGSLFFL
jgi:hypothetical protein